MAHNPEIPAVSYCSHDDIHEYWHDGCGDDACAVNECSDCQAYATDCGDTWTRDKDLESYPHCKCEDCTSEHPDIYADGYCEECYEECR